MTKETFVAEYARYVRQREKIKARQREELEIELTPFAERLGHEIVELQNAGHRIEDVAAFIGMRGRNFLYKMKSYLPQTPSGKPEDAPTADETPTSAYDIVWGRNAATVDPDPADDDAGVWVIQVVDGEPVIPEEWLIETNRERRKLYATILSEIENHDWDN